ncbi:MAG TPA: ABC transporter permease [bacterium]|nr:ABC transporter permease [bacterium]HPN33120.1 ABC transporter permease [bacterium]
MKKRGSQNLILLLILVSVSLVLSLGSQNFSSGYNILNILRQVSLTVLSASVVTLVMISGGLDLSIGGVLALAGVAAARLSVAGLPLPLAFAAGILIGIVSGALNGSLIIATGIPPVIATLGTMYISRGLAYILSGGSAVVNGLPNSFGFVGETHFGPLPLLVVIMMMVIAICHFLLTKTVLGRHIYAMGGNLQAANLAGIPVKRVKLLLYTLSGTMAGISGVLLASRLSSGDPNVGIGFEFDVIVAIVLGGTSLAGGEGTLSGTLLGALILAVFANGMNLLGIGSFYQYVVQGAILVLAVILDLTLRKKI